MDCATTSTTAKSNSTNLFQQILRILFFRAGKDELSNLSYKHLAGGLLCTWIVGMGRYWDDPCAYPLQHLGLGSVFYVFVLSFLLWLVILLLRPAQWSYRQVLTYVTLTSPPAIIYAIPVERFLSMNDATNANVYFLIIVALWRVALMAQYLRSVARLRWAARLVGMLFPVTTVITLLFLLDQHRAVFEVMGGLRHHLNPHEGADVLLNKVVGCSTIVCVPAAVCYLVIALVSWKEPIRILFARHRVAASIVSLSLVSGITYGIVRCMYKSPSDRICSEVEGSYNEQPQKKEALYTRAIELDPRNARAFAGRAIVEDYEGKYVEAVADFNRAIELDRNNSSYLEQRAYLFKSLGRLSEALADSRDARRIETVSSLTKAALPIFKLDGLNNLWSGQVPLGSPDWKERIWEQFQNLAWVRMPHGALYSMTPWNIEQEIPLLWRLSRLDEALSSCNRLVDWCEVTYGSASTSSEKDGYVEDAALTKAYRMRGYTYHLMGRKNQALLDFEHALAIVKDNPSSLFFKARMLKELGRKSEARDTFLLCEKALAQLHDDTSSKEYAQVLTLVELARHKEAVLTIGAHKDFPWWGYVDQDCNLPATMWETGKLYQLTEMNDLAKQRFLSALNWMKAHAPQARSRLDFLLWRTRLYLAIGDKDNAAAAFQQACKLGFGGPMPSDDLSDIDMNLLVEGRYKIF